MLLDHGAALLQGEMALARAEVKENLRALLRGVVLIVVAVIAVMVAVNLLADAAVLAVIAAGIPVVYAPLLVGAGLLVLAALLLWLGLRALRPANLIPRRTVENLRRDAEMLLERTTDEPQT